MKTERKGRQKVISVRLSSDELNQLQALSALVSKNMQSCGVGPSRGFGVSTVARMAILAGIPVVKGEYS